jgi:hypothetical protein
MITETATFTCSICGEPSSDICAYCTKDTCVNHLCTRCKRCSDCCECEVPLSEESTSEPASETHGIPEASASSPTPDPAGDADSAAHPETASPEPPPPLEPSI